MRPGFKSSSTGDGPGTLLPESAVWHRPPKASIQAVTFDVGGTLIGPKPSVGHVYAEVAARHGFTGISPDLLNRQFAAAWRTLKNFGHTRSEWATLVDATFQGLIDTRPSQSFFPELYRRFSEADAWHVFDDVVPTLERLAAGGFKLGVISNWDERLRPLLRVLKLDCFFEAIVVSCEAGASKPARAIFEAAAAQLDVPAEKIAHVGDSLVMDVQGAQGARFQGVLLQREPGSCGPGAIGSLRELVGIVALFR